MSMGSPTTVRLPSADLVNHDKSLATKCRLHVFKMMWAWSGCLKVDSERALNGTSTYRAPRFQHSFWIDTRWQPHEHTPRRL